MIVLQRASNFFKCLLTVYIIFAKRSKCSGQVIFEYYSIIPWEGAGRYTVFSGIMDKGMSIGRLVV